MGKSQVHGWRMAPSLPTKSPSEQSSEVKLPQTQFRSQIWRSARFASNTVSLTNLAQRQVGPNVGAGGLAMSLPIARQHLTSTSFQDITNLTVTIQRSEERRVGKECRS